MIASSYISECWPADRSGFKKIPPPSVDLLKFIIRKPASAKTGRMWISEKGSAAPPAQVLWLYKTMRTTVRAWAIRDDSRILLHHLLNRRPDVAASIGDFPGEPYRALLPIPIALEWTGDEYVASFEEANIAMTGPTQSEALGNVTADILDTFELYVAEETKLGPEPARQLAVLRRYIGKR